MWPNTKIIQIIFHLGQTVLFSFHSNLRAINFIAKEVSRSLETSWRILEFTEFCSPLWKTWLAQEDGLVSILSSWMGCVTNLISNYSSSRNCTPKDSIRQLQLKIDGCSSLTWFVQRHVVDPGSCCPAWRFLFLSLGKIVVFLIWVSRPCIFICLPAFDSTLTGIIWLEMIDTSFSSSQIKWS